VDPHGDTGRGPVRAGGHPYERTGRAGQNGAAPAKLTPGQLPIATEYVGSKAAVGRVAHVVKDQAEAVALWNRLVQEGRMTKFMTDPRAVNLRWHDDSGRWGNPPAAWIMAGSGEVFFNYPALPSRSLAR
jgi:hypothetical protein